MCANAQGVKINRYMLLGRGVCSTYSNHINVFIMMHNSVLGHMCYR